MIKFPLNFEVFAEAEEGVSSPWHAQTNAIEPIKCCLPVEFSGPGGGYTPEDLFTISAINCIIGAFKFHCDKQNQSFKKIKGKASLTLSLEENEKLCFTALEVFLEVEGAKDKETIKKILEDAITNCPVCNAIKVPKTLHIDIK